MAPTAAAAAAAASPRDNASAASSVPGSPRVRRLSRPSAPPSRIDLPSASSFPSGFTNAGAPPTGGARSVGAATANDGMTTAPPSSFFGSRPPSPSYYREALADIHASLYAGAFGVAGESHGESRALLKDCVDRWYETDAVFENPLTRSTGRVAIANQFCWLASMPGQRWSEVGDVCESQDFNGNHILVLSHTLHNSFFPSSDSDSHRPPLPTPFQSVPPTPFAYTPAPGTPGTSIVSEHHFNHHAQRRGGGRHLLSGEDYEHEEDGESGGGMVDDGVEADDEDAIDDEEEDEEDDYDNALSSPRPYHRNASRSRGAGKGGSPLALFISFLHPRKVLARLGHYHLRVITRLEFNEQGRVAYHEDFWGVKELVEGTVPLLGQLYYFQRQAAGTVASWLARSLWSTAAKPGLPDTPGAPSGSGRYKSRRGSMSVINTPGNLQPSTGLGLPTPQSLRPSGSTSAALKYGADDDAESEGYDDDEQGGSALAQAARKLSRQQRRQFLAQQSAARENHYNSSAAQIQRQQSQKSIRSQKSWGSSMGLWRSSSAQPQPDDAAITGQSHPDDSALGLSSTAAGTGTPPLEGAINITSATEDRRLRRRKDLKGKGKATGEGQGQGEEGEEVRDGDSSGREKVTSVAQGAYDDEA